MAEVHLRLDDDFVNAINQGLKTIRGRATKHRADKALTATEIAREALSVYRWVIEQTAADRAVVAADKDRQLISQFATPNLPALAPSGFSPKSNAAPPPPAVG